MVDKQVGNAGTLRIVDNGSTVSFYVLCGDPITNVGEYRFAINGTPGQTSLPAGFGSRLLGTRTVTSTQTVSLSQQATGTQGLGGAASLYVTIYRATVPPAPSPLGIDAVTPTSARYRFSSNGTGGSSIIEWQAQAATNSAFSANVQTATSGGTTTFTNLLPGNTYYFRSRGRNAVGWGAWSTVISTYVGLPAPTLNTWLQNGSDGLVANWSAPSTTTGLIGYRLQVSTNESFTANVQNFDVGDVLTATATGLPGGRLYYARVAARTAGGVNAYSTSKNTMLVLSAGDLDGWSRVGTKPANISYFTSQGIRRGTVNSTQALFLESLATGAAVMGAGLFGMQKTVAVTDGKAYRLNATITARFTGAPTATQGRTYRLAVGSTLGTTVEISGASETVQLPELEFVASGSTAVIKIMLADALNITGAQDQVESIAVTGILLEELATDFPQRLRSTVYESNLANHFDLACNSVGATWYVDATGVTRFRLPGAYLPVSAVFSDEADASALSYVDIQAGFDTRSTVNRIEATNFGVTQEEGEWLEENDELLVEDVTSQMTYGVYRSTLAVNLFDEAPYTESFQDRLDDLLEAYKTPQPRVSQIRWNAQESLQLAKRLEVGQRIAIRYRGLDYDSQIVNLQHDITPHRWMVTLNVQPIQGTS